MCTVSTIWGENVPLNISMSSTIKRQHIKRHDWLCVCVCVCVCVCWTALYHMQGIRGKIRQGPPAWPRAKIGRKKSWTQGDHTMEPTARTDRTVPENIQDITVRDNEKGTCMLIDVAISGYRNVIKREAEKILKYKHLTTEEQSSGM